MTDLKKDQGARTDAPAELFELPVIIIVESAAQRSIINTHQFEDFGKAKDYIDGLRSGLPSDQLSVEGKVLVTVKI